MFFPQNGILLCVRNFIENNTLDCTWSIARGTVSLAILLKPTNSNPMRLIT